MITISARDGDNRDLQSFPTRRSSDLPRASAPAPTPAGTPSPTPTPTPAWRWASAMASRPARSEEHTSELQSRENLVCRLLLEKKNNQQRVGLLSIGRMRNNKMPYL